MVARRILIDSDGVYIPLGSIIAISVAIIWGLCKWCARKGETEQNHEIVLEGIRAEDIPVPSQSQSGTAPYPQFASSTGYSPGVVQVPSSIFDNYSPERTPFTRAQMESMTVDELKILKQKLNMGNLGPIPQDEFIDMALAVQGSLASPQTSAPSSTTPAPPAPDPAPASRTWGRSASISTRNPATGLMECGICTYQMGGGAEKSMAAAPCGHAFCYDCLSQLDKCPTCRKSYSQSQIIRIYSP